MKRFFSSKSEFVYALFAIVAIGVYIVSRLWEITSFPIYFFTDEATFPLLAERLLNLGFKDGAGNWFPIYYEAAAGRFTPVFPMYIHTITVWIFGKSIFVTRATAAITTVLAPIALILMARFVYKKTYYFLPALVLGFMPLWFLHSRTAFETCTMASFYACFLLFYTLYLKRSPWFLIPSVLFASLAFYSYSNGQPAVAATAILLLFSDIRTHIKKWKVVLVATLFAAICAIPLISFQRAHADSMGKHLKVVGSYLFDESLTPQQKADKFIDRYSTALSPQYWFYHNQAESVRHVIVGYGNIQLWYLPFFAIGLLFGLLQIYKPEYRVLFIAMAASVVGPSLAELGLTRVMAFTIPAALFISFGVEQVVLSVLGIFGKRSLLARILKPILGLILLVAISILGFQFAQYCVTKGPTWFTDYGLYGMQFGAKQLFEEAIPKYQKEHPDRKIFVSSTWANGADQFVTFFDKLRKNGSVQIGHIDLGYKKEINGENVFIINWAEYNNFLKNPLLKSLDVEYIVPLPTGDPGFYFVRPLFVDNIEEVLAAQKAERMRPVESLANILGQSVTISHSKIDAGGIANLLDNNGDTLIRGAEANPFEFTVIFPKPAQVKNVKVRSSVPHMGATLEFFSSGSEPIFSQKIEMKENSNKKLHEMYSGAMSVSKITIKVSDVDIPKDAGANIHLNDILIQ